jgi:transcriptional regulator with XRE-family HTH domain
VEALKLKLFPQMLKEARESAGLTFRQLKHKVDQQGVCTSITLLNFIEKGKTKPTYDTARAIAKVTGIDVEEAMRSAFAYRMKWCFDRERDRLLFTAREQGISQSTVKLILTLETTLLLNED